MEDSKGKTEAHKHRRYEDRHDLSGEHKYGDIGQLIFLALFFVLWGNRFLISSVFDISNRIYTDLC